MSTTTKKSTGNIFSRLLKVQKEIDAVPKRGYNSFHKYHYATEADILTVKKTLNDNGLIVMPTTLSQETGFKPDGKSWARVTLLFKVVDAETGEEIESIFTGYAEDNFDKAIYKATTGANKYFYLKFFGIATEDDPEREEAPTPGRQQGVKSFGSDRYASKPTAEKPDLKYGPRSEAATGAGKNQALVNANKILSLQKKYGLTNDEVLLFGEIESIKELAEAGEVDKLAQAYIKLTNHVRMQEAI